MHRLHLRQQDSGDREGDAIISVMTEGLNPHIHLYIWKKTACRLARISDAIRSTISKALQLQVVQT